MTPRQTMSVPLMGTRTFSLWWGSNDKFRGEREPGVNGICDEAVGFDAFHGFAGRLEFGFALEGDARSHPDFGDVVPPLDVLEQAFGFAYISDRDQIFALSEREECQHHARIERADEQLFRRPDGRHPNNGHWFSTPQNIAPIACYGMSSARRFCR
jgi:hypothetical protein